MTEIKRKLQAAIQSFTQGDNTENALALFSTLGYNTIRQNPFKQKSFACFEESFLQGDTRFNQEKACVDDWRYVDLLFQLSKNELSDVNDLFDTGQVDQTIIETYLFFVLELESDSYSRTGLSQITREINKVFPMPVMVLFKYNHWLTLSVINRRLHKRDTSKDVLEKVTLIKDIHIENPHRAHIEILFDLSFQELLRVHKFTNFVELHHAWQKTLDTKELNKRFYKELSNWYFWAINNVSFPNDVDDDKDDTIYNSESVIRMLTRLIFIWFIKEKGLIPEQIFNPGEVNKILKNFNQPDSTVYYRAILQNLFFATLNQTREGRKFADEGTYHQNREHFGVKNVFRYAAEFNIPKEEVIEMFDSVPFLNGGLFDCLDSDKIYLDGFSRNPKKKAKVPDYLFFSEEQTIDLSEVYADKKKKHEKVKGLFEIFNQYKFTITENTPIEEEVALDPELLGRVFENLLASYNPETRTTARKQTGSFYTPREIVNYMVDESLKAYLKENLVSKAELKPEDAEAGLELLLGYNEKGNVFNPKETGILIVAIDQCKILDPACGSGAFPMGILHKLVHILDKLDPGNKYWREIQRDKAVEETRVAFQIGDKKEREERLKEINEIFENNSDDYGRKLFLIENCIYGIDIQPIAVQISKLRFFISLIVDQNVNRNMDNFGIRALPNLETKFVAANTLIGLKKPESQKNLFENPEIAKAEEELKELRHRYFSANTRREKLACQKVDEDLRKMISDLLVHDGWEQESAKQIIAFNPYDQNASSPFFDSEWMFGIKQGFDIVIGNPPYVEHKKLKYISKYLKNHYRIYAGTADLYVYFYEQAMAALKNRGICTLITSNKFIKTEYGKNLRAFLTDHHLRQIIDFTRIHVFDALVASCVIVVQNENIGKYDIVFTSCNDSTFNIGLENFISLNKILINNTILEPELWLLEKSSLLDLKKKIEKSGNIIEGIKSINVYRGITTGYNPAFIISSEIRDDLIEGDNNSKSIIKPILQGRNIKKWFYSESDEYLIQTEYNLNIKVKYKSIFKHLDKFYDDLSVRADQGENWWNLRACKYYNEFEKEKIIWGLTADKWAFAYDDKQHYLPSNGYILTSKNIPIKYILAVLNSTLMQFYFGFIGIMTAGGAFTLKHGTILKFPLAEIDNKKPFIKLVDSILNNPGDTLFTQKCEKQLNLMVYKLYKLTYSECQVVDPEIEKLIDCAEYEKATLEELSILVK